MALPTGVLTPLTTTTARCGQTAGAYTRSLQSST